MALIKCQECGREISDKASACPGCGSPIQVAPLPVATQVPLEKATVAPAPSGVTIRALPKKKSAGAIWLIAVAAVLAIIVGVVVMQRKNEESKNASSRKSNCMLTGHKGMQLQRLQEQIESFGATVVELGQKAGRPVSSMPTLPVIETHLDNDYTADTKRLVQALGPIKRNLDILYNTALPGVQKNIEKSCQFIWAYDTFARGLKLQIQAIYRELRDPQCDTTKKRAVPDEVSGIIFLDWHGNSGEDGSWVCAE